MLFGSWAEGKPRSGGQWVVALPEDKPAPLFTLLAIVHGKSTWSRLLSREIKTI
jgi:hypothetical protein